MTLNKLEELKTRYHNIISNVISQDPQSILIFSHFGDFDSSKLENTLSIVESGILNSGSNLSTCKLIGRMLVELLQNISIHGAKDESGQMHSFLIVFKRNNEHSLFSGNLIISSKVEEIDSKMKYLTTLNREEIHSLYIETLSNDKFSKKGGAGLGLLTLVKRATNQIIYNVKPINDSFGFFELEISITK